MQTLEFSILHSEQCFISPSTRPILVGRIMEWAVLAPLLAYYY